MSSGSVVGPLTKAFILLAFINFIMGASLGGFMAVMPKLWSLIGPVHGEINPYGWLTMLIYGMTYAVLSVSAGLRPPRAWVGWLHLASAELGVCFVSCGYLFQLSWLLRTGFAVQSLAPSLFLVNILSAVFAARKGEQSAQNQEIHPELAFLGRLPVFKQTDRVAQRGTDLALILFIVGTWWYTFTMLVSNSPDLSAQKAVLMLVDYGWIAGTVLAVWLHLFPRFTGGAMVSKRFAAAMQALWLSALILIVIGTQWMPSLEDAGNRMLGIPLIGSAAGYLSHFVFKRSHWQMTQRVEIQSKLAWLASWCFAFALGTCLLLGLDPLSLAALHLLFLGWVTTLIYGVGYTLFPLFLGRRIQNKKPALMQLVCSILGAGLMSIAFLLMDRFSTIVHVDVHVLGIGGVLSAIGAIWFLLQWIFA